MLDNPKVRELSDEQLTRIREVIDREKTVEGDLRREVNMNIRPPHRHRLVPGSEA